MHRVGLLLLSASIVSGCAGVAANESVSVLIQKSAGPTVNLTSYEKGKQYLQLKQYGLAVAAFQQEMQENPDSVRALNGLAIAYDQLGRQDVAQKLLDKALNVDPNSAITLNNLAYLNLIEGNSAVALAYSERAKVAVRIVPDMPVAPAIAEAVSRNAEITKDVAANDGQSMLPALIDNLPEEGSNVKRVGLNEWELRLPAFNAEAHAGTVYKTTAPGPVAGAPVLISPSDVAPPLDGTPLSTPVIAQDAPWEGAAPDPAHKTLSREIGTDPVPASPLVQERNVQLASALPLMNPGISNPDWNAPVAVTSNRQTATAAPIVKSSSGFRERQSPVQLPSSSRIRVSNGVGRRLMATRFSHYLEEHGVSVHRTANAAAFNYKATVIFYNPDQQEFACELAKLLPFEVKLIEAKRGRGWIEVVLGADLIPFDNTLRPPRAL